MTIRLSGITWDHSRGYAPLADSIARYRAVRPDVEINWAVRSLKDFGEMPLERLAERYDMIVFDHPFVGQAHKRALLRDLTPFISDEQLHVLNAGALGPSWASYHWRGGIYGLPIDAAAQVAAYRADLLLKAQRTPPVTFDDLFDLAHGLRAIGSHLALTACPTDAMCMLLTLLANSGSAAGADREVFIQPLAGEAALTSLRRLVEIAHPKSTSLNPIQALDLMSTSNEIGYVPYTFGYTNYARAGATYAVTFFDIVSAGTRGCAGTLLGGAGFGVTAKCEHPREAAGYGLWLCEPTYQRTHYFDAGGQPGMLQAWTDPDCDRKAGGFFSGTIKTLQSAYLRPRAAGFVAFFEASGELVHDFLIRGGNARSLVAKLSADYRASVDQE